MSLRPHEYEVYALRGMIEEVHTSWEAVHSLNHDLQESWRDEFSRFRLWECSMSQQLTMNWDNKSQLATQTMSDVYKRALQLLSELLEYLDDIYNILSGVRQDQSQSNNDEEANPRSSEEVEPVSEIAELWLMVKDVVTSLLKAVALARRNGGSHHVQNIIRETTRTNESLGDTAIHVESVQRDFPKLEHKEWLLLRINNAITYKQLWLSHSSDRERQVPPNTRDVPEQDEETMPSTLYFCTFEHCNTGLFSSRASWANHERMCHRRQWHCPICSEAFDDQDGTAKHVSEKHSYEGDGLHDLVYAASPPTLIMRTSDCAFCDDITAWDSSFFQSAGSISEPSSSHSAHVSLETYEDHMCQHMHHLASLAISPAISTDPETLTLRKALLPQMQTGTTKIASFSPQKPSTPSQALAMRRSSLSVPIGARHSAGESSSKASPGLSRLPSLRHKRADPTNDNNTPWSTSSTFGNDLEYIARESAREVARRQRALDEAILRRQEDLEAAETRQLDRESERARYSRHSEPLHRLPVSHDIPRRDINNEHVFGQLDRESERARYRRSFDPLHRLPDSHDIPRRDMDNEHVSRSRHASPPARPSPNRPIQTRARFASSSPLAGHTTHRYRSYGHATVHQYHYPDVPATRSRRLSDSIRERGREVIERERAKAVSEESLHNQVTTSGQENIAGPSEKLWKPDSNEVKEGTGVQMYGYKPAAAEDHHPTVADDARPDGAQWEPVFDGEEDRVGEREYHYVSEGSARQEIQRRRDRGNSRQRREGRDEFFR
jgi:hypothetical protein